MISKTLFFILCAIPVCGMADDQTSVAGPVSGFVFDAQSHAVRPMLGVPGAAYLGDPVLAGVDAAGIAPDGSAALAVRGGQLWGTVGLNDGTPQWSAIDGAIAAADRFAWAADGSAAVYSSAGGSAQIVRKQSALAAMDLSGLPGTVAALALAGDNLLIGVAAENGGGVYLVAAGSAPRLLAAARNPVAIAVAGADLYLADRDRDQIWQIRNFAADATAVLFADSTGAPVGIQLSPDGQRLFAANAGSRTVSVFDVNARAAVKQIDLDFTPALMERFGERSLMLLNTGAAGQEPLYVLDGREDAAVYFVPAGREQ